MGYKASGTNGSKLLKCNCKHDDQQSWYGDLRQHNKCKGPSESRNYYRCTVCTSIKEVGKED